MKILNLTREDMIERFKNINLEDIQPYCFYFETNEEIRQADLVIMREDNKYKVLKTRTDLFERNMIYNIQSFLYILDSIFVQNIF